MMNRVLIAFDKFKDAVDAGEACAAAAEGWASVLPGWEIEECPWSDGGEGFSKILTAAAGGQWVPAEATAPRGGRTTAGFGLVNAPEIPKAVLAGNLCPGLRGCGRVALVGMPLASGLALLEPADRDPWRTTSLGTGELMAAAARAGADAILLGVGGSATNDLGLGALDALGLHAVNARGGRVTPPVPASWSSLAGFRGGVADGFPPVFIACDVANPLLGPRGCTAVYGPQKGLKPKDAPAMEAAVARMAGMLSSHCGRDAGLVKTPGAGAAGGIAFGLLCAARARLVPGSTLVTAWLGIDKKLRAADVVLTGEGSFDASSLEGKGPGSLALDAARLGRRVFILAGQVAEACGLPEGVVALPITPPGTPLPQALADTPHNLRTAAAEAARQLRD